MSIPNIHSDLVAGTIVTIALVFLIIKVIKLARENEFVRNLLTGSDRYHGLETLDGDSGNTSPSNLEREPSPAMSAGTAEGIEGGHATGMANPSTTVSI